MKQLDFELENRHNRNIKAEDIRAGPNGWLSSSEDLLFLKST